MLRPFEPGDGDPDPASCPHRAADRSGTAAACPRCQALEDRIAALEAELAAIRAAAGAVVTPVEQPGAEFPPAADSPAPSTFDLPRLDFRALRLIPYGWGAGWGLRPSPARRAWMDEHPRAYQCLPLVIANQWGWQILCPTEVRVDWDGTPGPAGVRVEVPPEYAPSIKSQFGSGIVTFSPPWLFRTPQGWDLYLKGPSNRWKPNCHPLEGIIETWWLNYTFTINWKLIDPGTVVFAKGESLGQLVPVPHATFREATALEAPIGLLEPEAARELLEWLELRRKLVGQQVNVHHLYRTAEGVAEHLRKVGVPAIESLIPKVDLT